MASPVVVILNRVLHRCRLLRRVFNKTYNSQKKLLSACIVVVVIVLLIAGFLFPPINLSSLILFQSSSTPLNRISESSRKLIELGRVERAILALAGAAPDATRSPSVGVWAKVKQHFSRRTLRDKKNQQHDEDGADMVWGTTFEYSVKSVFMRREDVFLLPVNSTSPLDELPRGFTLINDYNNSTTSNEETRSSSAAKFVDVAALAAHEPPLDAESTAMLRLNLVPHLLHFSRGRLLISAWIETVQRRSEFEWKRRSSKLYSAPDNEDEEQSSSSSSSSHQNIDALVEPKGSKNNKNNMNISGLCAVAALSDAFGCRPCYRLLYEQPRLRLETMENHPATYKLKKKDISSKTSSDEDYGDDDTTDRAAAPLSPSPSRNALNEMALNDERSKSALALSNNRRFAFVYATWNGGRLLVMSVNPRVGSKRRRRKGAEESVTMEEALRRRRRRRRQLLQLGGGGIRSERKSLVQLATSAAEAPTCDASASGRRLESFRPLAVSSSGVRCITRLVAFASAGEGKPFVHLNVPGIAELGDANVTVWRDFQSSMLLMMDGSEVRTPETLVREGVTVSTVLGDAIYIYGSHGKTDLSGAPSDLEVSIYQNLPTSDAKHIYGELAQTISRPLYVQPDLPED